MRHFLVMLMVAVLGFGLAVEHAEARRLGGGSNVGSFSRQATAPKQAAPARQAKPNRAAGSRMPGMLAGMLAGGLLAALFFGGAFDELRLMDILLMAGLGLLLFRLLARRRTAVAGGPQPHAESHAFQSAPGASMGGGNFGSLPAWFDRERFLSGAKEHFMTLQRAWDNNDFGGIQEYVTPELYNLLREERSKQPANNRTEIGRLFAELGDVREVGGQAEATVIFHGILEENGEHTEFNETWHLIREVRDGAPWYLQGIEQNAAI
ncbi:Tim44 domain-containing protein [Billgrantia diversa]|uniref:Tim44 domain-containing protein n=1 Tax=Halomonas sp. MCCC 1A13316 TaxID=2733487 RepID=UPI0018A45691|nr:Tim44-like domain-containing protein [Halomonas sp. MCCC 1A13316]QOR37386.1 Tim44 domain-containing protein [Halomonas sp. MCCC 1A13316]